VIPAAQAIVTILQGPEDGGGEDDSSPPEDDGPDGPTPREAAGSETNSAAAPVPRSPAPAKGVALGVGTGKRSKKTAAKGGAFFQVAMLPAAHGDCLWIEYGRDGETNRILVDCGTDAAGKILVKRVEALPEDERHFELFVMSHIDADHIGGALPFLKVLAGLAEVRDVWFNGWRHVSGSLGPRQAEMFSTALSDFDLPWNKDFDHKAVVLGSGKLPVRTLPGGMKLTLLSPTQESLRKLAPAWTRELKKAGLVPGGRVDYRQFLKGTPSTSTDVDALAAAPFKSDAAPANGSSIALLAEFEGASILLGADAYSPVLETSIDKLLAERGLERFPLSAFKLPHHGSQNNLSRTLLERIACKRYLVSTNGNQFYHPDREAVARVIKYGGEQPELLFNYRSKYNDVWGDESRQASHRYSARFGDGELLVDLL
jgi:beta-lactamase superfamily II metal-dependent hydrolase